MRDAYVRIADRVARRGSTAREQHTGTTDRVVALATALADEAVTPEGRFYGHMGPGTHGALSGVTGTASSLFLSMLTADLHDAARGGALDASLPVDEIALLVSGAIRQIGETAAQAPEHASELLQALRYLCDSMLRQASA